MEIPQSLLEDFKSKSENLSLNYVMSRLISEFPDENIQDIRSQSIHILREIASFYVPDLIQLTVGNLRNAIKDLPDDTSVVVDHSRSIRPIECVFEYFKVPADFEDPKYDFKEIDGVKHVASYTMAETAFNAFSTVERESGKSILLITSHY